MKIWFVSKSLLMMLISFSSMWMILLHMEKSIIHIDISSFLEISLAITLLIDLQSLIFISTVSAVSSLIIIYSFFYLEQDISYSLKKFLLILLSFIISMFILSLSANSFWLLIGWDGLGISSFCLIIFYQNWKSFSSGMVTFLSNRLGDTFIIISMIWVIMNQSSDAWMFPSFILMISFLMSIGAYSKSAQLPYLFWLPQAMAAPTPVSALVHSSTLVTAGIYLMCRFQPMYNLFFSIFFFFISSITVLIAGSSSLMEFDLKKIIALSTLCHISLMMMFSILGEVKLSLFHMMTHAFFKSLLFMIAGVIIHLNSNFQDIRIISISKKELAILFPFFISILSMMGFPFLSGFYSKEALFSKSLFDLPSIVMTIMFLMNSFFSCAYSIRLAKFLFSKQKKKFMLSGMKSFEYIFIAGSILSSFLGGTIIFVIIPEEEMIQPSMMKVILLITSITGMLVGLKVSMNPKTKILNPLTELWKSDFIYKIFQSHFFFFSNSLMWIIDEKGTSKNLFTMTMKKSKKLFSSFTQMFMKEPFSMLKSFQIFFLTNLIWAML